MKRRSTKEKHSEIANSFIAPWTSAFRSPPTSHKNDIIFCFFFLVFNFSFFLYLCRRALDELMLLLVLSFARFHAYIYFCFGFGCFSFLLLLLLNFCAVSLFSFDWLWSFGFAHSLAALTTLYEHPFSIGTFSSVHFSTFSLCALSSLSLGRYCARAVRLCLLHDT